MHSVSLSSEIFAANDSITFNATICCLATVGRVCVVACIIICFDMLCNFANLIAVLSQ